MLATWSPLSRKLMSFTLCVTSNKPSRISSNISSVFALLGLRLFDNVVVINNIIIIIVVVGLVVVVAIIVNGTQTNIGLTANMMYNTHVQHSKTFRPDIRIRIL